MPEKSGMDAELCAAISASPVAGAACCPDAGPAAAANVASKSKFRRAFMSRLRLNQQSYEADKQGATDDHGPVPDIKTEKPAVGCHKSNCMTPPTRNLLVEKSARDAVLLLPA